jgi:hypothetical protein
VGEYRKPACIDCGPPLRERLARQQPAPEDGHRDKGRDGKERIDSHDQPQSDPDIRSDVGCKIEHVAPSLTDPHDYGAFAGPPVPFDIQHFVYKQDRKHEEPGRDRHSEGIGLEPPGLAEIATHHGQRAKCNEDHDFTDTPVAQLERKRCVEDPAQDARDAQPQHQVTRYDVVEPDTLHQCKGEEARRGRQNVGARDEPLFDDTTSSGEWRRLRVEGIATGQFVEVVIGEIGPQVNAEHRADRKCKFCRVEIAGSAEGGEGPEQDRNAGGGKEGCP